MYLSVFLSPCICLSFFRHVFVCLSFVMYLSVCLSSYICLSFFRHVFVCLSFVMYLSVFLSACICLSFFRHETNIWRKTDRQIYDERKTDKYMTKERQTNTWRKKDRQIHDGRYLSVCLSACICLSFFRHVFVCLSFGMYLSVFLSACICLSFFRHVPKERQTNTCRKKDRQIHAERKTNKYMPKERQTNTCRKKDRQIHAESICLTFFRHVFVCLSFGMYLSVFISACICLSLFRHVFICLSFGVYFSVFLSIDQFWSLSIYSVWCYTEILLIVVLNTITLTLKSIGKYDYYDQISPSLLKLILRVIRNILQKYWWIHKDREI
jgi:hypothetical protein